MAEGEAAAPARRTRTRKPRTESARIDDETEGGAEGSAEAKAPRAPKKRLLPTGEASKVSLLVFSTRSVLTRQDFRLCCQPSFQH